MTSEPDSPTTSEPNRCWQFSLRTLMLAVAAISVALSILVGLPDVIAMPVLMCLAVGIPPVLVVVLVCGTRLQRAFCTAALFPTGAMLFVTAWVMTVSVFDAPGASDLDALVDWMSFFDDIGKPFRVYSAGAWLLAMVVGGLAVWIRWRIDRSERRRE
ncbi:MAG: hypothetical protein JXB62_22695 [Pirellulales bacterium]|nr:hypothetical protein [Pirellulales bacterium]